MYADSGLLYPYFQSFSPEFQQLEEYCNFQKINVPSSILDPFSAISDYDWGTEGDLFKAPETFIEEPELSLDPMTAAMSMISCGDEANASQQFDVTDMNNGQLFSDVFYEVKKDLLEKAVIEPPMTEAKQPKPVSSDCMSSTEWTMKANFLEYPAIDFVYGMRRAFSEGDIETLNNANVNYTSSRPERPPNFSSEDRKEKLSRYRSKKSKRNFDRKIKYACRKALADSQPRIRGRFARTDELDSASKGH